MSESTIQRGAAPVGGEGGSRPAAGDKVVFPSMVVTETHWWITPGTRASVTSAPPDNDLTVAITSGQYAGHTVRVSPCYVQLAVAPPPPPPPAGPPRAAVKPAPSGRSGNLQDQLAGQQLRKDAATKLATRAEEIRYVNEFAAAKGLEFRIPDGKDKNDPAFVEGRKVLLDLKRAVGVSALSTDLETDTIGDITMLTAAMEPLLRLGWPSGSTRDTSSARQAEFAESVRTELLTRDPSLGARSWPNGRHLDQETLGFPVCQQWATRVTDRTIYGFSAKDLAALLYQNLGNGLLGGIFPGEVEAAQPEDGNRPERAEVMLAIGRDLVARLRRIDTLHAELTGSLVLRPGGYTGLPRDVDVNVVPRIDDAAKRKEQWKQVEECLRGCTQLTVTPSSGSAITVTGEDAVDTNDVRALRRFYGYTFTATGGTLRRMRIEVEIKDVAGAEWTKHLRADAAPRTTTALGDSEPRWLLVDALTRSIQFREDARGQLAAKKSRTAQSTWATLSREIGDAAVGEARDRMLAEKTVAALTMTGGDPTSVSAWLATTVRPEMVADYETCLAASRDRATFEKWLVLLET